jgi:glutathione S-transferase
MAVVLWHIEISHYNEKVRWALDHKRIPHVRRTPTPGLHGAAAMLLTRSGHRRLPVLDLDGRRIGDSTAIIAALEAYRPEPPLYPADPAERERALALEDFFDEHVAPAVRLYAWYPTLPDARATAEMLMTRAGPARKAFVRTAVPLLRPLVYRDYGIAEESAARALVQIRAGMDRLEAELQASGYLAGDRFSVADLTAAALFTPIVSPPGRPYLPPSLAPPLADLRDELHARPGGRWILDTYARHR